MKKILILLLLISFNVSGAGTESSNNDSTTTSDQINSLYELAEKDADATGIHSHVGRIRPFSKGLSPLYAGGSPKQSHCLLPN